MKVALCLSGQPRFFKKGFEFIYDFILKPFNPDVFMHVWFDPQKKGQSYSCSNWNNGRSDIIEEKTLENLQSLYHPKSSISEPEKFSDTNLPRDYSSNKARQSSYITFSQFYSIQQANFLKIKYEKESNFLYDCVFKMRFDWAIQTLFDLENMDLNTVYVPDGCPNPKTFSDQFAFSNSKNMDIYSSAFNFIDDYWVNDKIMLVGEWVITHHLQKNNIKYQFLPIKQHIIRGI